MAKVTCSSNVTETPVKFSISQLIKELGIAERNNANPLIIITSQRGCDEKYGLMVKGCLFLPESWCLDVPTIITKDDLQEWVRNNTVCSRVWWYAPKGTKLNVTIRED